MPVAGHSLGNFLTVLCILSLCQLFAQTSHLLYFESHALMPKTAEHCACPQQTFADIEVNRMQSFRAFLANRRAHPLTCKVDAVAQPSTQPAAASSSSSSSSSHSPSSPPPTLSQSSLLPAPTTPHPPAVNGFGQPRCGLKKVGPSPCPVLLCIRMERGVTQWAFRVRTHWTHPFWGVGGSTTAQ